MQRRERVRPFISRPFPSSLKNGPFPSPNFSSSDDGEYGRWDLHQEKEGIYIPFRAWEQKGILALTLKQIAATQIVLGSLLAFSLERYS